MKEITQTQIEEVSGGAFPVLIYAAGYAMGAAVAAIGYLIAKES